MDGMKGFDGKGKDFGMDKGKEFMMKGKGPPPLCSRVEGVLYNCGWGGRDDDCEASPSYIPAIWKFDSKSRCKHCLSKHRERISISKSFQRCCATVLEWSGGR